MSLSKISIPLKKLSKSSFDLADKSFDSKLSGEWLGNNIDRNSFLNTYIQEKFKISLHIVPMIEFSIIYDLELRRTVLVLEDYHTLQIKNLAKDSFEPYLKLFRNTSKRFTFFPVSIAKLNSDRDGLTYHAISSLYDKKTNKVEIFDSIGSDFKYFKKSFKELFNKVYGVEVKIIYLVDRCVAFGKLEYEKCDKTLYKYKSEGFCAIWVLWFLELRLSNPDIPKEKLIEKALRELKKGDKVCRLLRGYSQFVDKTISKFDIIRTSSNLMIKPKASRFVKKDLSLLYVILASLIGSIAAFGILKNLRKK